MITANADWTRVVATRLMPDATLRARDLGPFSAAAAGAALACSN
jgi:hypothetical protein